MEHTGEELVLAVQDDEGLKELNHMGLELEPRVQEALRGGNAAEGALHEELDHAEVAEVKGDIERRDPAVIGGLHFSSVRSKRRNVSTTRQKGAGGKMCSAER